MAFKINSGLIGAALALATPILTNLVSGKGARYQKVAENAIRAAVTATDGGLDHLVSSFREFEAANPLVQAAVTEFDTLAKAAGITVPSLDAVQSHIKSAIYDLATTLVPLDQLKAPVLPATETPAG